MTTVTICKNKENGSYTEFHCMGHAQYAKKGEPDILCSAVSALVIGTINGLDELAGEKLDVTQNEENGFIRCVFLSKLQEKSIFLLECMILNLQEMSKEYGKKYLQVKFEEV